MISRIILRDCVCKAEETMREEGTTFAGLAKIKKLAATARNMGKPQNIVQPTLFG